MPAGVVTIRGSFSKLMILAYDIEEPIVNAS